MKPSLVLAAGLILASASAGAEERAPTADTTATLRGRLINRAAASCGAAYRGKTRLDFRRSSDGMEAGSVIVGRGKAAAAALAPGAYDVRVYVYSRKAFRYATTRHLEITHDRWRAALACADGASVPGLQQSKPGARVVSRAR